MNTSEMTPDELRLAIAEELGQCICDSPAHNGSIWCLICHKRYYNYPCDIEAAMGLEEEVCKTTQGRLNYIQALQKVVDWVYNDVIDLYDLIHATARQRGEAWLQTRRE